MWGHLEDAVRDRLKPGQYWSEEQAIFDVETYVPGDLLVGPFRVLLREISPDLSSVNPVPEIPTIAFRRRTLVQLTPRFINVVARDPALYGQVLFGFLDLGDGTLALFESA